MTPEELDEDWNGLATILHDEGDLDPKHLRDLRSATERAAYVRALRWATESLQDVLSWEGRKHLRVMAAGVERGELAIDERGRHGAEVTGDD